MFHSYHVLDPHYNNIFLYNTAFTIKVNGDADDEDDDDDEPVLSMKYFILDNFEFKIDYYFIFLFYLKYNRTVYSDVISFCSYHHASSEQCDNKSVLCMFGEINKISQFRPQTVLSVTIFSNFCFLLFRF